MRCRPSRSTTLASALGLLLLVACGGGSLGPSAPVASSSPVPLAEIVGYPLPMTLGRSPDGHTVASLRLTGEPGRRRLNLFVERDPAGGDGFPLRQITFEQERNLEARIVWFSNRRIGFLKDPKGDECHRLYAVDIDGHNLLELTPPGLPDLDTLPLCAAPEGGHRWLVVMGPAHGPRKHLYWIDPVTGEHGLKESNPGNIHHAIPDARGRILLAVMTEGTQVSLKHRRTEADPFQTLATGTYPDHFIPIHLAEDGRTAAVLTNSGRDTFALYEYDLVSATRGRLLKEALPGYDLAPEQCLELPEAPAPEPTPAPAQPAAVQVHQLFISYPARDGHAIPAILTLPAGPAPQRLPAVVHCHGGPWGAAALDNPEVIFLASRGIAVLQPDFRGSTGRGKAFHQLGFCQHGRSMQDDLSDGAHWLARAGYANPERIAIMGTSYGGYAALAGATFTPDLFRCAISRVGPSELVSRDGFGFHNLELERLMDGDPVQDEARLREVSPLFHADRIRIPLLIGHGAQDSRVPIAHSERMVQALAARGVFVPYMAFPNEGHGLELEENRLAWYRAVENFLGLHLGSRVEAPTLFRLTP